MIDPGKSVADELYEQNVRAAVNTSITIDAQPLEVIIKEAAVRFNKKQAKAISAGQVEKWNAEHEVERLSNDQRALVAAHIRHNYSNYDNAWRPLFGLSGGAKAHQILKDKTFRAIKSAYPELLPGLHSEPTESYPSVTIIPSLTQDEVERLLTGLSSDEAATVNDALTEEITLALRPLEELLAATNERLKLPHDTDHFSQDRDVSLSRRFVREAVREALANQSDFETIALSYLDRPGFGKAWDILYKAVSAEFARHYPRLAIGFNAAYSYNDRDWQAKVTSIQWKGSSGTQNATELLVITTTYYEMVARAGKRVERLRGLEAYQDSILTVCLDDYTNFQTVIAARHQNELSSDLRVRLSVMEQVYRAIADSHPLLRTPAEARIQALERAWNSIPIKAKAPSQEELSKRKAHQSAVQQMLSSAKASVSDATHVAGEPVDSEKLPLEEQCQKVRQLMHSHPDYPKHQSAWMKLQPSMQPSARLIAMFRMHFSILVEHPDLAEAVAHEVSRHEKKIMGKELM